MKIRQWKQDNFRRAVSKEIITKWVETARSRVEMTSDRVKKMVDFVLNVANNQEMGLQEEFTGDEL